MEIVEYFESDRKEFLRAELSKCSWESAQFLGRLLTENSFDSTLGGPGKLFFLLDGNNVVSFLTLTRQDCVNAPDLFPWIGFVHTVPAYRGRRAAGELLRHAIEEEKV